MASIPTSSDHAILMTQMELFVLRTHSALFYFIFVSQAYPHASSVIQSLGETDITVNLLVQVDKLVRLLETPIFAYLRLQVNSHALCFVGLWMMSITSR